MAGLIKAVFGSYSDREIKRLRPIVARVEALGEQMRALTDLELAQKTPYFKERLAAGESLDDILPEAFAVVREASVRVLGMEHFPVQIMGGIVLHQGRIAEMKTGEGKTLVATLPAYLNALTGEGVHIVTVNDYLAKRDSEWMGKVYKFLGLSVGLVIGQLEPEVRRKAYNSDITYGTNNEMGFDYLRDNMVISREGMVQRGHVFAIVDEVDSILIDEARTPLIISGLGDKSTGLYELADRFAKNLRKLKIVESDDKVNDDDTDADYIVDEKAHTVTLTKRGIKKAEGAFGVDNLSDPENMTLSHHINQAIRAYGIMHRDQQYVVKDGEVLIVDEFTGRLMIGRRYSDGLHQAIEAKEGVSVARENKTLATITFQNYFRLYKKLSGMTGTAKTEETEFRDIYGLDVVEIPTNKPMRRDDLTDLVYKNEGAKLRAVIEQIDKCHRAGQPVLVGTITIEKSELLSKLLKKRGIPHEVLNAKYHEKEALIVAQAGKKGAVTIATNMAGRGTDIVLGGNAELMAKNDMLKEGVDEWLISETTSFSETDDAEVLAARARYDELYKKHREIVDKEREAVVGHGGLYILGTERHESRRIDNQLRGRSGRQGDPGVSRFFISLEDDLMRLFGSERVEKMIDALGLDEDEPIEHNILSKAIENAQKRIEGRNFDMRKHVLQYDDVMNQQREIIYAQRRQVLDGEDMKGVILKMLEDAVHSSADVYTGSALYGDEWNWAGLTEHFENIFGDSAQLRVSQDERRTMTRDELKALMLAAAMERYEEKEREFGPDNMRELERVVLLQAVDNRWMAHIDDMDQLRQGIGLMAYGQRDPIAEYKFIGFDMFEEMIQSIREDTVRVILHARAARPIEREKQNITMVTSHGDGEIESKTVVNKDKKVGRNDPCPCGSGKKYKKCHGQ